MPEDFEREIRKLRSASITAIRFHAPQNSMGIQRTCTGGRPRIFASQDERLGGVSVQFVATSQKMADFRKQSCAKKDHLYDTAEPT
ncbi:hypothetical protein CSC82_01385 [Rhodobacteraceae bacterium 4F10]|nr:hypothetical protein CSC82_01385 [Rhodobacteraceae bacterium 4F10]